MKNKKDEPIYVTKDGLEKLKTELKELIEIRRPEVALKIKEAREMGDLSENALYDSAREEQAFIEGRIKELEEILKKAEVAEKTSADTVSVGCKVTLHLDGKQQTYHVVGVHEADPLSGKISNESPLGKALLGKKVGDKVDYKAPVGDLTYTIIKVEY